MSIVLLVLKIIGSLGVFLFGMKVMSDGLQKAAGDKLQKALNLITKNRFAALLTGLVFTGIIQSSSATTVLVVSFVNAGLLTLQQSIGVIMGANIGTTVTAWIVALIGFSIDISAIALPVVAIGLPLYFIKRFKAQDWGEFCIGFGLLFIGIEFLKNAIPPVDASPALQQFIANMSGQGILSTLIFFAFGLVLTLIVHSSSATTAMFITMANAGWIDFAAACAMVLGANIGTTVDAFLASLGTNTNARRAAWVHILFNCFGALWALILIQPMMNLVDWIVPGTYDTPLGVTTHIAAFHTVFNTVNAVLLIGFVPQFAKLVEKLIRQKEGELPERYRLPYLAAPIQDTPEINLVKARVEVARMARLVDGMFGEFLAVLFKPPKKLTEPFVEEMAKKENLSDEMREEITAYLNHCVRENLKESSLARANMMARVVLELERVGDACFNLCLLVERKISKKIDFFENANEDIRPFTDEVRAFLSFILEHLDEKMDAPELEKAYAMETTINELRNSLKKMSQKRIRDSGNVRGGILFIDVLQQIEHVGDYCLNIAQALRQAA